MTEAGRHQRLQVHLFVTGRAEEAHLPKLFLRLQATGVCLVTVSRRIDQVSPRSGQRLQVVGTSAKIPSRRETQISLPARKLLRQRPDRLLLLIDDLEHARRPDVDRLFTLYRSAIDHLLQSEEQAQASVHFLVNMLEAYFFADPEAVKQGTGLRIESAIGDPERIRNPKRRLSRLLEEAGVNYREIGSGGAILQKIDLHRVLSAPETCAWLRSCVRWLVSSMQERLDPELSGVFSATAESCHLKFGRCEALTLEQRASSDSASR